ncbi:hypothetical protein FISHEDRAFT_55046 [Fistulina hepatica ATCC 64428]|uniref:Uncharacterized protein n=1 Tax=Fistulina hepatica ATCC 64428 TaxID=1128425 RepID=A0A0D7AP24_9AGAR|nr:hypothetical protein FISHEDRAFT_55046 [Fistulina hepatica ATCC 64428]
MAFRATAQRLIQYIGSVTLDSLPSPGWRNTVHGVVKGEETSDPRIKKAKIKGSVPHKSSTDPSDPKLVISVQLLTMNEHRIKTIHIHEDESANKYCCAPIVSFLVLNDSVEIDKGSS